MFHWQYMDCHGNMAVTSWKLKLKCCNIILILILVSYPHPCRHVFLFVCATKNDCDVTISIEKYIVRKLRNHMRYANCPLLTIIYMKFIDIIVTLVVSMFLTLSSDYYSSVWWNNKGCYKFNPPKIYLQKNACNNSRIWQFSYNLFDFYGNQNDTSILQSKFCVFIFYFLTICST